MGVVIESSHRFWLKAKMLNQIQMRVKELNTDLKGVTPQELDALTHYLMSHKIFADKLIAEHKNLE